MENYRICTLADIGEIVSGATPRTNDSDNFGGNIAWLTPADLSGYSEKYISHGARNLTEKGYNSCGTRLMPKGAVLFSSRAPIGYVAIADNPICTNQGFKSIIPNESISSEFLYYQLKYLKKTIQDMGSGTTFKEISAKKFSTIKIIVPSLTEQECIVARIEELFSQLDAGVDTLKKTKAQLAVYRQAVLKEAFEKVQTFVHLGNVVKKVFDGPFGSNLKTADYTDHGIRVVRLENIKNGWFDDSKKSFITLEKYETIKAHTVIPSDLILSTFISESIKICQLPSHIGYAANKADCVGIRLKPEIEPRFLLYYLSSKQAYNKLIHQVHGATRPRVNTKQIKAILVPFVPKDVQEAIISKIDSRMSVCDSIEQTVDIALQQAEAMRQSILKEAFEGRL